MLAKLICKHPEISPLDRNVGQTSIVHKKAGTIGMPDLKVSNVDLISRKEDGKIIYESDYFEVDYGVIVENIPRKGLVLELLFFEGQVTTVHDTSGNGNNGTIYGATWDQLTTGKKILKFDGIDDYAKIPYDPIFDTLNEITVLVWVRLDVESVNVTAENNFRFIANRGSWRTWNIILEENGRLTVSVFNEDGIRYVVGFSAGYELPPFEWHMVGLRYRSSTGRVEQLVDGKVHTYRDFEPKPMKTGAYDIYICADSGLDPLRFFPGSIGLFRLYNRWLSDEELEQIYELEAPLFGITP